MNDSVVLLKGCSDTCPIENEEVRSYVLSPTETVSLNQDKVKVK